MRSDFIHFRKELEEILDYSKRFDGYALNFDDFLKDANSGHVVETLSLAGKNGALEASTLCKDFEDIKELPDIESYCQRLESRMEILFSRFWSTSGQYEKDLPKSLLDLGRWYLELLHAAKRKIDEIRTKRVNSLGASGININENPCEGFVVDLHEACISYSGEKVAMKRGSIPYRIFEIESNKKSSITSLCELFECDESTIKTAVKNFKYSLKNSLKKVDKATLGGLLSVQNKWIVINAEIVKFYQI